MKLSDGQCLKEGDEVVASWNFFDDEGHMKEIPLGIGSIVSICNFCRANVFWRLWDSFC